MDNFSPQQKSALDKEIEKYENRVINVKANLTPLEEMQQRQFQKYLMELRKFKLEQQQQEAQMKLWATQRQGIEAETQARNQALAEQARIQRENRMKLPPSTLTRVLGGQEFQPAGTFTGAGGRQIQVPQAGTVTPEIYGQLGSFLQGQGQAPSVGMFTHPSPLQGITDIDQRMKVLQTMLPQLQQMAPQMRPVETMIKGQPAYYNPAEMALTQYGGELGNLEKYQAAIQEANIRAKGLIGAETEKAKREEAQRNRPWTEREIKEKMALFGKTSLKVPIDPQNPLLGTYERFPTKAEKRDYEEDLRSGFQTPSGGGRGGWNPFSLLFPQDQSNQGGQARIKLDGTKKNLLANKAAVIKQFGKAKYNEWMKRAK